MNKRSINKPVSGLLAVAVSLALLAGPGWAQSLKTIPVPEPALLFNYVLDRNSAIQLGKALFWDMQVGSDGIQACASCHFSAGADSRFRNQMNPNTLGGSVTFTPPDAPNSTQNLANYPFYAPVDPDTDTPLLRPFNKDVTSSQGVKLAQFVDIKLGSAVDVSTPLRDPVWNLNLRGQIVNVRRVEPRNTPTVINAAFNMANFWDGRANNIFNGVSPFGPADTVARIFQNNGTSNGPISAVTARLENAALASQAVGPPLSEFEMSFRGRTWPKIGKKMLSLPPLAKQSVHPRDSVLGTLAKSTINPTTGAITFIPGLNIIYEDMIKKAFQPQYWRNTNQIVTFAPDGTPTISPLPPGTLTTDQYTQMEANFSFFFGLAVQLYEETLIANDSPLDRFLDNVGVLTPQQQRGFVTFKGVGCINCHVLPETTEAAAIIIQAGALAAFPPVFQPPLGAVEIMNTANRLVAFYDTGWINIAVVPTQNDPGRIGTAPFINPLTSAQYPLSYTLLSMLMRDNQLPLGTYPNGYTPFVPPLPIGNTQPPDRNSNHGAFKIPGLRNVELTGPYMHNGGMATLRQVVDFYTRGGNFDVNNLTDLDPAIAPIGQLLGLPVEKDEVVAFLLAMTDDRVRNELAPFDHPELFVPHGNTSSGIEINFRVPPVGAGGRPAETPPLPPLQPFLNADQFQP